jgi:hypothetical protein
MNFMNFAGDYAPLGTASAMPGPTSVLWA